jgi:hypothetical protein
VPPSASSSRDCGPISNPDGMRNQIEGALQAEPRAGEK